MCKHVLNAQVSLRAPCCKKWFDCPECHAEACPDHPLAKSYELTFVCKKCKKCFRKDIREFEESDEYFFFPSPKLTVMQRYCPHCDNHFILTAKMPEKKIVVELEGTADMIKDERAKSKHS